MKGFWSLFLLLLRYPFIRDKSAKGSRWIFLAVGILAAYGVALLAFLSWVMWLVAPLMASAKLLPELLTLLLFVACMMTLIFGIVGIISSLYFARDYELLSSLPLSPSAVFVAKLLVIYVGELVLTLVALLPLVIVIGVAVSAPPLFFVVMTTALLMMPFFALAVASILAVPIMYLVSWFRNRGAVTSVAVIVIFVAVMSLYFVLVGGSITASESTLDQLDIVNLIIEVLRPMMTVAVPLVAIARLASATTAHNSLGTVQIWQNIGLYIGIIALMMLACWLLSKFIYQRGASAQVEGAKRRTSTGCKDTTHSIGTALMLREWRELVRTPAFAFQSLAGVVLTPMMVVFVMFSFSAGLSSSEVDSATRLLLDMFSVMMMLMMIPGMNLGVNTSITREGSKFYYTKLIPVSYVDQIKVRKRLYMTLALIPALISAVVQFVFTLDLLLCLMSLLTVLPYCYAHVCFALTFDLAQPKLQWTTPNEAVKHSRNAIITTLLAMAGGLTIGIFMSIAVFVAQVLLSNREASLLVGFGLGLFVAAILALICHSRLGSRTTEYFDRIEP